MSPSKPWLTNNDIISSFDKESAVLVLTESDETELGTSGIGGRSTVPFFTFIIIAFAFARTILSSQEFTASMSPSKPWLTSRAIC